MIRYVVVSILAGLLFAILDGFIHANPLAQELLACYKPIARASVKAGAGIVIDLTYGLLMAAIFLQIARALPGGPLVKGVSYGAMAWFFRVAMPVAGSYVMFDVPGATLLYQLAAGLVEMVLLGALYGLALRG